VGKRSRRSGYTLIEVLLVLGIMVIIGAGAMALMIGSVSCFDTTTTEAFTDADAVIAMQMIVNDVREAKSIRIIAGGTRLRVIFPKRTAEGYYDRHEADMANQIDYYLSDDTGVPGHAGTWLWRGKDDGSRRLLKKDVWGLEFEQDTSRSVKITVTARNNSANGPKETQLTQRVVYLRNY
jgi:prepilin-type N-terminal cleavage/methylation domain-containing protein